MTNSTDKNKYDLLVFLYSILNRLDCGDVDTFEHRIKSQKIQYFAQLFGVSFRYNYNLYIKGPYSPELAHDLYEINQMKIKPIKDHFIPDRLENRFFKLKSFIEDMNIRELELVATYHWLIKIAKFSMEPAKEKLIFLKKASAKELSYVLNKFNEYEQIKGSLD